MTAVVRARIAEIGVELERLGILDLTAGNISARVGDGAIAITPSGIPYGDTKAADVVVCRLADGAVVEGERRPSSELALHRAVYAARPEAGAVVHTHSPYATTLAVLRRPIPAVHYVISRLATTEVPVVDATYGTQELAQNAFDGLAGTTKAILLAITARSRSATISTTRPSTRACSRSSRGDVLARARGGHARDPLRRRDRERGRAPQELRAAGAVNRR